MFSRAFSFDILFQNNSLKKAFYSNINFNTILSITNTIYANIDIT